MQVGGSGMGAKARHLWDLGPEKGVDKGALPTPLLSVINWGPHGHPYTEMVCPWDCCEDWGTACQVSPAQCLVRS